MAGETARTEWRLLEIARSWIVSRDRQVLQEAGVPSLVVDQPAKMFDPFVRAEHLGTTSLLVPDDRLERARELLAADERERAAGSESVPREERDERAKRFARRAPGTLVAALLPSTAPFAIFFAARWIAAAHGLERRPRGSRLVRAALVLAAVNTAVLALSLWSALGGLG